MSTPTPRASAATVSAALDRLASSRERWARALDGARQQREQRPTGLLALLGTWTSRPAVTLATGLWAAWARHRAQAAPRTVPPAPAVVTAPDLRHGWSVARGLVRRHPVVWLSGLSLVLAWAGWRHFVSQRPSRPR